MNDLKDDPFMERLFILDTLHEIILKTTKPTEYFNSYKVGVTEDYFFTYLKEAFGIKIYRNLTINLTDKDKIELNERANFYQPDFVFHIKKTGLCIDIEIDEPYIGTSGDPIHYLRYDDYRDQFFLLHGWFVVRFTENQAFLYPRECCKLIVDLIKSYYIRGGHSLPKFSDVGKVPKEKQWTREEATKLATQNYRNSYLSGEYIERLEEKEEEEKKSDDADDFDNLPF